MKLTVETADELKCEGLVGDALADVLKGICEGLETPAVFGDGEVALDEAAEFCTEDDGAPGLVVHEEEVELRPDVVGGAGRGSDDVEEVIVDHAMHPQHDGEVVVSPHGALAERLGGDVEVVLDLVLAGDDVEELAPTRVVPRLQLELGGEVVCDEGATGAAECETGSRSTASGAHNARWGGGAGWGADEEEAMAPSGTGVLPRSDAEGPGRAAGAVATGGVVTAGAGAAGAEAARGTAAKGAGARASKSAERVRRRWLCMVEAEAGRGPEVLVV